MRDGRMHQTTVRFGPDLWEALEEECGRLGISAAQFVRESTLARLSYAAGRRHEGEYAQALSDAGVAADEGDAAPVGAAVRGPAEQAETTAAVSAQSELAWRRAREVRAQSEKLRRWREEVGWHR